MQFKYFLNIVYLCNLVFVIVDCFTLAMTYSIIHSYWQLRTCEEAIQIG